MRWGVVCDSMDEVSQRRRWVMKGSKARVKEDVRLEHLITQLEEMRLRRRIRDSRSATGNGKLAKRPGEGGTEILDRYLAGSVATLR